MAVSRHHAAVGCSRRGRVAVLAGSRTRSACWPRSARPLRRCSASRPGRSRGSSRAGTCSCADRSRDAAHGTSVSDCRRNFWMGWTNCCAMPAALIALDGPPVILTGEYIPENFLLSRDASGWRLSGLIDFGDVMTGRGEYDLLGPSALHGRRHAAAGAEPVRGLRIFSFGYHARSEAAADGADAAASLSAIPSDKSASRAGNRRPPISTNCRICSGRFECRTSMERSKYLHIYMSKYASLYAICQDVAPRRGVAGVEHIHELNQCGKAISSLS